MAEVKNAGRLYKNDVDETAAGKVGGWVRG